MAPWSTSRPLGPRCSYRSRSQRREKASAVLKAKAGETVAAYGPAPSQKDLLYRDPGTRALAGHGTPPPGDRLRVQEATAIENYGLSSIRQLYYLERRGFLASMPWSGSRPPTPRYTGASHREGQAYRKAGTSYMEPAAPSKRCSGFCPAPRKAPRQRVLRSGSNR